MAVLQMQRVSICALKKDRKAILEKLQALGVMEMNQIADEEGFEKMDTVNAKLSFEKKAQLTETALGILDIYAPQKQSMLSGLAGKELVSQDEFQKITAKKDEAIEKADALLTKSKEIAEIKGKKYAEYYYYILQGAKITYAYTVFLVFMLLSVLAGSVEAALLGVIFSVLVVMYIDLSLQDKLTARRQEILMDLPQVLSKLTLLVNSGMVLRDAWKRTAITGERALYKEMQNTSLEIDNGIMEADAYRNFADRCSVKEVRKFTSLILQNLQKGNEELALFLGDMSTEMWEMKKNEVKQKGEKANSRLLLPVFLIFIGILILILVPVMSGLG